jgi:uncharacterized protein
VYWSNGLIPLLVDTTVLSNFAAIKRLDLLRNLFGTIHISYAVYSELQTGLDEGYEFLAGLESHIFPFHPDGWINLVVLEGETEVTLYENLPSKLHRGEAMSLAIAAQRDWHFLTDDRAARAYATKLGISVSGTIGVLIQLVKQQHLDIDTANECLAQMILLAKYRSPLTDLRTLITN